MTMAKTASFQTTDNILLHTERTGRVWGSSTRSSDSMSVIGNPLAPAEFYTETLEEVLGLRLFEQNAGEHKKLLGIARQVETLTHGLTTDRPRFLDKHYLSDRKLREAYQLYYTTTNLLKIIPPLRELALSGIFEHEQIDVLDLGTGTGAALWGLIQYFEQERKK